MRSNRPRLIFAKCGFERRRNARPAAIEKLAAPKILPVPSPEVLNRPTEALRGENYDWLIAGFFMAGAFFFGFAYLLWRRFPKGAPIVAIPQTGKREYWNTGQTGT